MWVILETNSTGDYKLDVFIFQNQLVDFINKTLITYNKNHAHLFDECDKHQYIDDTTPPSEQTIYDMKCLLEEIGNQIVEHGAGWGVREIREL